MESTTATAPKAAAEKPAPRRRGDQTPFTSEENARIIDQFTRDGYVVIPGILAPEEIGPLRERIERFMENPKLWDTHNRCDDLCILRLFELNRLFLDFLTREPMISLM